MLELNPFQNIRTESVDSVADKKIIPYNQPDETYTNHKHNLIHWAILGAELCPFYLL